MNALFCNKSLNKFPFNGFEIFIIIPLTWNRTITVRTQCTLADNGSDFNSRSPTGGRC